MDGKLFSHENAAGFWGQVVIDDAQWILKIFDGCDTFVNSDIIGFQFRNVFLSTWILNFPIDARAHSKHSTVLRFHARRESMHSIKTHMIFPSRRLANLCMLITMSLWSRWLENIPYSNNVRYIEHKSILHVLDWIHSLKNVFTRQLCFMWQKYDCFKMNFF